MQTQTEREAGEMKISMNPWQRVCANVEFSAAGTTPGGKDVSRIKYAMLARKSYIT